MKTKERPTTLAALKRYLKPGMTLMLTEHIYANPDLLPIRREIMQATPTALIMSAWPGKPVTALSSMRWPKASEMTIDDKGFVVNEEGIRMRYEYVDCPHGDHLCPCQDGAICHYVAFSNTPAAACPRTGEVGCTSCN